VTPPDASLVRATRASAGLFATLGMACGAWGAHVPSVKSRYALDEASLSWLLLAAAAGAVCALFIAGRLVMRWGVARCVAVASLLLGAALAGMLHAPGLASLLALMVAMGAAMSVFDVAINAEGTLLENLAGRAVLGRLHALFSVGGMAGAGGVSALYGAALPAAWQLALFGAGVPLLGIALTTRLLAQHPPESPPAGPRERAPLHRGVVWMLGLLTLLAMVSEGAMYDWSVLYLEQELQQAPARAALGFAVFSAAMAAGRFGADALRTRWPEGRLLAAGAAMAGMSMAVLLGLGHAGAALVGYALMGIGLAPAVPILYAAATRIPGVPRAVGIAAVSSIGYAGFMLGPPAIGSLARAFGLGHALLAVVAACLALALAARRIP